MTACATWLRRDFLIRYGRTPDEPACDHNPQHCPPDPAPADDTPKEN